MPIAVEERDGECTITVTGEYGSMSVEQAVGHWLQSTEGAPFEPGLNASDGKFSSAIRQMR